MHGGLSRNFPGTQLMQKRTFSNLTHFNAIESATWDINHDTLMKRNKE